MPAVARLALWTAGLALVAKEGLFRYMRMWVKGCALPC